MKALFNWLGNRALKLPHAVTVAIAKRVDVEPGVIEALNDKLTSAVLDKAVSAIVGK